MLRPPPTDERIWTHAPTWFPRWAAPCSSRCDILSAGTDVWMPLDGLRRRGRACSGRDGGLLWWAGWEDAAARQCLCPSGTIIRCCDPPAADAKAGALHLPRTTTIVDSRLSTLDSRLAFLPLSSRSDLGRSLGTGRCSELPNGKEHNIGFTWGHFASLCVPAFIQHILGVGPPGAAEVCSYLTPRHLKPQPDLDGQPLFASFGHRQRL